MKKLLLLALLISSASHADCISLANEVGFRDGSDSITAHIEKFSGRKSLCNHFLISPDQIEQDNTDLTLCFKKDMRTKDEYLAAFQRGTAERILEINNPCSTR